MNIRDLLNKQFIFFDGSMGTLLQRKGLKAGEKPEEWNITHSDTLIDIHLEYLKSGANVITANTFGANSIKFENLEEIISAAMANAKRAIEIFGQEDRFVAFDVGPLGKMLEPLGDMPFESAVEIFSENVRLAEKYGADLIIIETMNDSYETKAAVLAAKENCDLPVFVTNVFDEKKKLMTGADPKAMIAMLEGLRVDAIGMNCSLGAMQMLPVVEEYVKYSSLPIIVNPNAGLPKSENGKTVYDVSSDGFSDIMEKIARMGVGVLGGCCGTDSEYIRKTVEKVQNVSFLPTEKKNYTLVSSYTHSVEIGNCPVLIGERINPTGKPKFKNALRDGNIAYIINEGVSQQEKGVHILDVNVGLPEIDEDEMIVTAVKQLQAVSDLPLQIDTVKASAMEKTMRIYNGKPLINSVNGKKSSMDEILPLIKKYGGTVIALTLDENGIPDTAEGRYEIAKKIADECEKYGIDKKDIIADPLAMAVSSDEKSGKITLDSVKMIKEKLGIKTSLGVSNISFGLPNRANVNAMFMSLAFQNGLDCAIMNPYSPEMMQSYYTYRTLNGFDENCMDYIDFASKIPKSDITQKESVAESEDNSDTLERAIIKGLKQQAYDKAIECIKTQNPLNVINEQIVPALDTVGKLFEEKKMYLPQLLMSAAAASKAFDAVKTAISGEKNKSKGKILVATVKGDIHDIGKNIVKVLLENYSFDVIDLGKDVLPEKIVQAVKEKDIKLVGLSALMTTTVENMKETIELLKKECPEVKTIVGGAVLTREYAEMIGATYYAKDAMQTVRFAQQFFESEK